MNVLNILLHTNPKPPSLASLTKMRGDGAYAFLTKSTGYSCKVVVVKDGQRAIEKELPDNSLGGFLAQLNAFMKKGLDVKAVLLYAHSQDGIKRACSRLKHPPEIAVQYVDS